MPPDQVLNLVTQYAFEIERCGLYAGQEFEKFMMLIVEMGGISTPISGDLKSISSLSILAVKYFEKTNLS